MEWIRETEKDIDREGKEGMESMSYIEIKRLMLIATRDFSKLKDAKDVKGLLN